MDEARISSEITREEEIRAQTQACKSQELETLHAAPNDIILSVNQPDGQALVEETNHQKFKKNPFFPSSVVLNSTDLQPTLSFICSKSQEGRRHVIQFLSLEKKAIKWYGICTSFCYFKYDSLVRAYSEISKNFTKNSNNYKSLISILMKENKNLERALFSLSEQDMNVPKIFLKAKESAKYKNLPINSTLVLNNCKKDGRGHDEDSEIDEISVVEVLDLKKKKGQNGIREEKKKEIIEIL